MKRRVAHVAALAAVSFAGAVAAITVTTNGPADGRIPAAFCDRHPNHRRCSTPETTTVATTTTTETATTTTAITTSGPAGGYLFADEFDGPGLDTTKWDAVDVCENAGVPESWNCKEANNVIVPGDGLLHLRASVGTHERPTDGAEINTFKGYAWPPNGGAIWTGTAPIRMEARIKYAAGAGMWAAFWPMGNVSNPWEMDVSEVRSTYPTSADCHWHVWGSGVGVDVDGTAPTTFDVTADFHVYWADYTGSTVTFGVDGVTCLEAAPVANQPVLLRLTNRVGAPTVWGGEGGPPPPGALPADMLVDWVRVSAL